jgi:two-component system, NtrC family, sensor kinase
MTAKVLFVDDDESNLFVCAAACEGDFQVLTALSADAALEWMRKEEVGVILTDQRMPGTTGIELLERVSYEYPDTIRLLVTAYSDMNAAVEAINRGGVRRYLKKPWVADELRAELRDALEVYQMKRELAAAQVRLRESERVYALGVVAAGIGHEIRNPISWIDQNLSHVQDELRKLAEQMNSLALKARLTELDAALNDASAGVERLVDIVRGMELSTRSSSERDELVDVSDVLRLTVRLVSAELRRAASIELDVAGAPKVLGSRTKLGQVVLNLIVNAIQALAHRPRKENVISVRLRNEGAWVSLQVADNGPGIPDAEIERVFEPFHTSKPGTGTGLGLAISRRITDELNGTLEVWRDERLGGACFCLRLPAS